MASIHEVERRLLNVAQQRSQYLNFADNLFRELAIKGAETIARDELLDDESAIRRAEVNMKKIISELEAESSKLSLKEFGRAVLYSPDILQASLWGNVSDRICPLWPFC